MKSDRSSGSFSGSGSLTKSYSSVHLASITPSSVIKVKGGREKRLRHKESYVDIIKEKQGYKTIDINLSGSLQKSNSSADVQKKSKLESSTDSLRKNFSYNQIANHSSNASSGKQAKTKNIFSNSGSSNTRDVALNIQDLKNTPVNDKKTTNKLSKSMTNINIPKHSVKIPVGNSYNTFNKSVCNTNRNLGKQNIDRYDDNKSGNNKASIASGNTSKSHRNSNFNSSADKSNSSLVNSSERKGVNLDMVANSSHKKSISASNSGRNLLNRNYSSSNLQNGFNNNSFSQNQNLRVAHSLNNINEPQNLNIQSYDKPFNPNYHFQSNSVGSLPQQYVDQQYVEGNENALLKSQNSNENSSSINMIYKKKNYNNNYEGNLGYNPHYMMNHGNKNYNDNLTSQDFFIEDKDHNLNEYSGSYEENNPFKRSTSSGIPRPRYTYEYEENKPIEEDFEFQEEHRFHNNLSNYQQRRYNEQMNEDEIDREIEEDIRKEMRKQREEEFRVKQEKEEKKKYLLERVKKENEEKQKEEERRIYEEKLLALQQQFKEEENQRRIQIEQEEAEKQRQYMILQEKLKQEREEAARIEAIRKQKALEEKFKREEEERLENQRILREKQQREREEAERLEQQRLLEEKQRKEKEEAEKIEKLLKEREEAEKLEKQRKEREEAERLEQQRLLEEKQRKEKEEEERLEQQRLLEEKQQREREEAERLEQQRLLEEKQRKEKEEAERLEQQRLLEEKKQKEREEAERLEQQRLLKEKQQREKEEAERLEQQRLLEEKQRKEKEEEEERLEQQRLLKEKQQREKEEAERLEQQRLLEEKQRKEKEEAERLEQQRLLEEKQKKEKEEEELLEKIKKEKEEEGNKKKELRRKEKELFSRQKYQDTQNQTKQDETNINSTQITNQNNISGRFGKGRHEKNLENSMSDQEINLDGSSEGSPEKRLLRSQNPFERKMLKSSSMESKKNKSKSKTQSENNSQILLNTNDYIYSDDDNMNIYSTDGLEKYQSKFDICILSSKKQDSEVNLTSLNNCEKNKNILIDQATQYTNGNNNIENLQNQKNDYKVYDNDTYYKEKVLNTEDYDQLNQLYQKQQEYTNRTRRILDSAKRTTSKSSIFEPNQNGGSLLKNNSKTSIFTNSTNNQMNSQRSSFLGNNKKKFKLVNEEDLKEELYPSLTARLNSNRNSISMKLERIKNDSFLGGEKGFQKNGSTDLYSKIPHHGKFEKSASRKSIFDEDDFKTKFFSKKFKTIDTNDFTNGMYHNSRKIKNKRSFVDKERDKFVLPPNPYETVLEAREFFFFND